MFEFLSELSDRTESPKSSIGRAEPLAQVGAAGRRPPPAPASRMVRHLAEVHEVLEVVLRQRRGVGDGVLRRDRAVGLDLDA